MINPVDKIADIMQITGNLGQFHSAFRIAKCLQNIACFFGNQCHMGKAMLGKAQCGQGGIRLADVGIDGFILADLFVGQTITLLSFLFGEYYSKGASLAGRAIHNDCSMMDERGMLDDGESQSGTAYFLGAAFIYPVKTLKDAVATFLRDADTCIGNNNTVIIGVAHHLNLDTTAGMIVLDGVIAEIKDHTVKHRRDTIHEGRFSP